MKISINNTQDFSMPRLSLYRQDKTSDYRFMDRTIREMYTVGGLDILVHKYLGPKTGGTPGDATQPVIDVTSPTYIEDLFLLENRDRAYDPDVYVIRGVYRAQDIDFDLTQFGLFLNNDTLFVTFHYNTMIDVFGRKLIAGDVLEVPNLKDYHPLDTSTPQPIPKYYVVQDGSYATEGFSQTWLPHLWRIKATPMVASQEYDSILGQANQPNNIWDNGNFYPAGSIVLSGTDYYQAVVDTPNGTEITNTTYWAPYTPPTLLDTVSTLAKTLNINDAVLAQAEVDVPLSGYDTTKFYVVPVNNNGSIGSTRADTADEGFPTADSGSLAQGQTITTPDSNSWTVGYLTGDGLAPDGFPVTPGVSFPPNPAEGDFALRLDYFPNRLFRFNGSRWLKIEDNVRTNLTPGASNQTLRSGFVNNTGNVVTTDRGAIPSRQGLSNILDPKADN